MKYRNLSHSLYVIGIRINKLIGKKNILFAKWWGVRIGKNCTFIGRCHFVKFPGTEILIGNKCTFLSKRRSNLIGIDRSCIISTSPSPFKARIEIGDNCGFSGTVIGAFKFIKLGNNVRCGANTLITDSDWHLEDYRSGTPADIIIGNNVWLGVNSTILKGVTIGDNSLIGANSLVNKSIPSNVIAAGNPCRVIRELPHA
jgi:acetyltransferase-like isoleucine patch superfamily enzyme